MVSSIGGHLDPSGITRTDRIGFLYGYDLSVFLRFQETIRQFMAHIFNQQNGGRVSLKRSGVRKSAALILLLVALILGKASSFIVDPAQSYRIHSQRSTKLNWPKLNKSLEFKRYEFKQSLRVATSDFEMDGESSNDRC